MDLISNESRKASFRDPVAIIARDPIARREARSIEAHDRSKKEPRDNNATDMLQLRNFMGGQTTSMQGAYP